MQHQRRATGPAPGADMPARQPPAPPLSSSQRPQRPSPRLIASTTSAGVATAVVLTATAFLLQTVLGLSAGYSVKAAGLFIAVLLVAAGYIGGRHPFDRFGVANRITTGRLAIVCLVAAVLGEDYSGAAGAVHGAAAPGARGVAAVAGSVVTLGAGAELLPYWVALACIAVTLLDGLDGWAARRTAMSSEFGARFDMETDALLVMVLSVLVWQWNKAGAWIVLAGAMRYLFVVATWGWSWMTRELFTSTRRKVICVVQIVGLTVVLLPALVPPASAWLSATLLALLSYSFLADTVWLWQQRD